MVPVREAGDIADFADHRGCEDRAGAEDLREGGGGGPDRCGELLLGLAHLGVDAAQVGEELGGDLVVGCRHRPRRRDALEEMSGLGCADPLGDTARDQLAQ
jgi:hypothetical protein